MIEIKQLSKRFGANLVLDHLTLPLEKGKVYGIVGENGAGKTTLFKCIVGIEKHEGLINSKIDRLKDHTGFLPTDPYFFPKITGEEYLRLMCQARKQILKEPKEKNIFELPLQQYADTYSTGMKKKLALTAILLQQNEFFILDEPFNGVDIQSNIVITAIIQRLKSLGKTLLISSHIFSTLRDTCDEIHLLKNGQLQRRVLKNEFDQLEKEMKDFSIGDRLNQLNLG